MIIKQFGNISFRMFGQVCSNWLSACGTFCNILRKELRLRDDRFVIFVLAKESC